MMMKLKHIKHFEEYSWLDKKSQYWDDSFKKVMDDFTEKMLLAKETLIDFNDDSDPDLILDEFVDTFKNAFEYITDDAISQLSKKDDIEKLYYEIEISIPFILKDYSSAIKKYEKTEGVLKIYETLFKNLSTLISSKKLKTDVANLSAKKLEIDDYREEFKKIITSFVTDATKRLETTNVEDIMKMANIQTLDKSEEIVYNAGDEIRYYTNDNEENTAFYSANQENLKERDNIRLVSKDNGEQFEIKKEKVIEIVKRSGDISNQIKQDLKEILADKTKVKKVAEFLKDLKEEE